MKSASRPLLLLVALLLAAGLAGWCVHRMHQGQARAEGAAAALSEARQLVARIEQLRERPSHAGAQAMALTDLTRLIELAAKAASMQPEQLVRIWPEPARRVDGTEYQHKPTQVLLRHVSLEQLDRFVHALVEREPRLSTSSLRLSAPRDLGEQPARGSSGGGGASGGASGSGGGGGGDRWTIELTLSYLIYSPPEGANPSDTHPQNRVVQRND